MNIEKKKSFKDEIMAAIKEFSLEQLVRLAFVSGMRALPFIGLNGWFGYWEREHRQEHLFAVFHAIDCGYHYWRIEERNEDLLNRYANKFYCTPAYADAAGVAAKAAARAASRDVSRDTAGREADARAAAARAAAYAADTACRAGAEDADTARAAYSAANAAREAATLASYAVSFKLRSKMEEIILNDIKEIEEAQPIKHTDTEFYGKIWTLFQKALRDCGCDYWADLYQELFRNHFEFDIPELERRLEIWDKYKDFGAAAAGEHLLSTRNAINVKVVKEARIILIGKAGAGKTSLARRLVDPNAEMPSVRDETHGVDTTKLQLGEVEAHIWDFGGQAVIYSAHKCFLASRCVYIIVCDGRTEGTKEADIAKDFENIKHYGGQSKVFVVVNKYSNHKVNFNKQFIKEQYPDMYDGYYEIDIQEDKAAVKHLKEDLKLYIAEKPT
jgi:signal recognition particle receptor subunit beta